MVAGFLTAEANLVGITTFFLKEGQNLNFALPGDWVKALAAHRFRPEEKSDATNSEFEALSYYQLGSQMLGAHDYQKAVSAFLKVVSASRRTIPLGGTLSALPTTLCSNMTKRFHHSMKPFG